MSYKKAGYLSVIRRPFAAHAGLQLRHEVLVESKDGLNVAEQSLNHVEGKALLRL